MGAGIAESASLAGFAVVVRELPEFTAAARSRLENALDGAVKRGKLDADDRAAALARVTFTSELNDVAGSDLVIEAVPENLGLKISIMKELNETSAGTSCWPRTRPPSRSPNSPVWSPIPPACWPALLLAGTGDEVGRDRACT